MKSCCLGLVIVIPEDMLMKGGEGYISNPTTQPKRELETLSSIGGLNAAYKYAGNTRYYTRRKFVPPPLTLPGLNRIWQISSFHPCWAALVRDWKRTKSFDGWLR